MNCFCGMVEGRKDSRDHCHTFSPSRIFYTPRAEFELAQHLSCAIVITTTPRRHVSQIYVPLGFTILNLQSLPRLQYSRLIEKQK